MQLPVLKPNLLALALAVSEIQTDRTSDRKIDKVILLYHIKICQNVERQTRKLIKKAFHLINDY